MAAKRQNEEILGMMELFCISIVGVVTQIYARHKTDIKRKKSILMYANVKI